MTEKGCFKKLISYKYKNGYKCPQCDCKEYWLKADRRLIICKRCRKEISPLASSMFSRSHIALSKWDSLIYMMCCSPDSVITAKHAARELEIGSYRTAWEAMNKIRYAISVNQPRRKMKGTIEFDELVINGIGSDYSKLSILGAIELQGRKYLSLQMIKNPDEMNIKHYFRKRFSRDVEVVTDPEKLYIRNWLKLNRISQNHLNSIYEKPFMSLHVILQDIKYGLKNGHHNVGEKYLQRNLDEFVFIFNNNDNRKSAYEKVLDYMVNTSIDSYKKSEKQKRSVLSIITRRN